VPPVPRTDATITLFCCDAVGLQLAHFGHQAAMRRCQLLGVKPTRRDPFPNFSTRFPGFCVGDRVRIRHLRVRILLGQPASTVSKARFLAIGKAAIFPPVSAPFVSLRPGGPWSIASNRASFSLQSPPAVFRYPKFSLGDLVRKRGDWFDLSAVGRLNATAETSWRREWAVGWMIRKAPQGVFRALLVNGPRVPNDRSTC
jgi:hypothetical protein